MTAAGCRVVGLVEINPFRRAVLARHFSGVPIHDDARTYTGKRGSADIVIGGPPCQQTSVASAISGRRTGFSLWPIMLGICDNIRPQWIVVEQPPGNAEWEAKVADDLCGIGYHSARVEFSAGDCGAPYPRRRVYIIACASLPRLEVAWSAIPSEIERAARAADARGAWDPRVLATLRVDARSAGEMERAASASRRERIEALGDSNPPIMAEVVGRALIQAA
jgi:DNA (cytosine-5)-methyltransferase 1